MVKLVVYKTVSCTQCASFIRKLQGVCEEEGFVLEVKDAEEADVNISTVPTTVLYSEVEPPNVFPGIFNVNQIIEECIRIEELESDRIS